MDLLEGGDEAIQNVKIYGGTGRPGWQFSVTWLEYALGRFRYACMTGHICSIILAQNIMDDSPEVLIAQATGPGGA